MKLSCLILTYNEEVNIARCLAALDWCDDIVVIDSGSTDKTLDIAREYHAKILHRPFDNFASQRNFGLDKGELHHEWVLHLDADEFVTKELQALLANFSPAEDIDGYFLPSKIILHGQWLKYAGMYPTYQARLGHRDRMRFIKVGHGQREDVQPDRMGRIDEPYLHYSFSHGMQKWLEKHLRYARDEAQLIVDIRRGAAVSANDDSQQNSDPASGRRVSKARAASLPLALRPIARFLYVYLFRKGFLDGRAGFSYAFMLAVYEGMTAIIANESLRGK
jgi:glycosyltransferase involved in cell wall biosynthesis